MNIGGAVGGTIGTLMVLDALGNLVPKEKAKKKKESKTKDAEENLKELL